MSERQEKKRRYNQNLAYIADFNRWLNEEPPILRFVSWHNRKTKPQLIEEYILSAGEKTTKKEILEYFPDIGEITVERTLHSLCQKGMIKKQGASRATFYVRCKK